MSKCPDEKGIVNAGNQFRRNLCSTEGKNENLTDVQTLEDLTDNIKQNFIHEYKNRYSEESRRLVAVYRVKDNTYGSTIE